jgi:hypothetical protein
MKISELLRHLADIADSEDQPRANAPDMSFQEPIDGTDCDCDSDLAPQRFIPPLQLKLELLKKAVDVENIYSPGVADQDGDVPPNRISISRDDAAADQPEQQGEDEIAQLRRRLSAFLNVDAGGDGPLDD